MRLLREKVESEGGSLDALVESEFSFCAKCNKYEERNYYNWNYRMSLREDFGG
eukprot:CAMPEP_0168609030 /NCGR_PEP_ID=MMETSP0449_2-20121227/975_1 /TAXON_ID=1082188 /ORGANISM="Strombidium rassoulzadegani, Strain ras09" /LENGTH=52 /DNA_ID=CAMNT_0008649119 /DNA_START=547 /DNA_END=705 /DNA_ORIENTATION=+